MNQLSPEQKMLVQNTAISSLSDEFLVLNGRPPELDELPDFANSIFSQSDLVAILERRNASRDYSIRNEITKYPDFFPNLANNLEKERINRRDRPAREVT